MSEIDAKKLVGSKIETIRAAVGTELKERDDLRQRTAYVEKEVLDSEGQLDRLRDEYSREKAAYTEGVINGRVDGDLKRVIALESEIGQLEKLIEIRKGEVLPSLRSALAAAEQRLASAVKDQLPDHIEKLEQLMVDKISKVMMVGSVWDRDLSALVRELDLQPNLFTVGSMETSLTPSCASLDALFRTYEAM